MLATDGLWDVVESDIVRRLGLCFRYHEASALATALTHKAQRRRDRLHMRHDDITVTVVDLHIDCGVFLKTHKSLPNKAYAALPYSRIQKEHQPQSPQQRPQCNQPPKQRRQVAEDSFSNNCHIEDEEDEEDDDDDDVPVVVVGTPRDDSSSPHRKHLRGINHQRNHQGISHSKKADDLRFVQQYCQYEHDPHAHVTVHTLPAHDTPSSCVIN